MPRVPALQPNEIYEGIKGLCFLDDDGKLLPWRDEVWQLAVHALQDKMSKSYLYLYLSKNRNDVFQRIHGSAPFECSKDESDLNTTPDDSRKDPNWSMGETDCALPPMRKAIMISRSEWDDLKSHIATYKDREYEVFVIGWTDKLYEILWFYLKLPCPFSFKNAHINRNPGEIFLSIQGRCSECESQIHIYYEDEPTENVPVTFRVSTFDSSGIAHEKKRQISGDNRIRIGKQLQGESVYAWRRQEANRLMDFGDPEPANFPSENVARKIKQEALDKKLGLHKVKNALASVWDMKYGVEFNGCIHEIGLDKFYVMYWSPTQLYMYNKFRNEDGICSISTDATGSLVKQIMNPADSKRVVYLYQAVCNYREKILPLFQMITEKHDTNTLTYWMREWLRSGGTCPKQVVTDYSLALLNATSLAFNNSDLKTYVENCIVFDSKSASMRVQHPRTLIRIDIAHLMKLVARWSCFKHESPEKKDFYLRCVGFLSMCTKIDEFIRICTDVVAIALSTHEDIDDRESRCFAAQNNLKSYDLPIDTLDDLENNDPDLLSGFDDFDTETLESSSAINVILKNIETNSTDNLKQGRLNPYNCADFGFRLLKLSKQFVLWTAVMTDNVQENFILVKSGVSRVASSARSEEYFRELKHLVFRKGKPIRIDKYLVIHLRSLEGTNRLLNAPIKKTKKCQPEITHTMPEIMNPPVTKSSEPTDSSIDSHDPSQMFSSVKVDYSATDLVNYLPSVKPAGEVAISDTNESEDVNGISMRSINDNIPGQSDLYNSADLVNDLKEVSSQSKDTTIVSAASEMAYLNEFEGWKLGHVINPPEPKKPIEMKKRDKYLTACPDINIIHKKWKFTPNLPLLANGNSLKPVKIRKETVYVKNTCAFDATVQSILIGCHDYATYSEYLADCHIEIFEFVQKFSTTGVTAALYTERGCILSTATEIRNGVLDCMINISYLQEKFILRNVPSLVRTVRCADCLFEVVKTLPVLHLDPISLHRNGMAGLQEALDKTCKCRSTSTCFRCKSQNIMKGLSGGNHLLLNIEDVGNPLLANRNGYPNCRRKFTLVEIPDKVVYDDSMYKFVSAIFHIPAHYFAFVKRVTGRWEEHND